MIEENLRTKKLLKQNFSWVFLINLIIGVINFFTAIYFARQLGPSIMGDYATVVVGFDLAFSFLSFGFNQFVISKKYEGDSYNAGLTAIIFQSMFVILLFSIFFLIYNQIDTTRANQLILPVFIIMIARLLNLFNLMFYSKLETDFNYKRISYTRFISTIAGLVVAFIWFAIYADLYTLIVREVAGTVLFIIVTFISVKPQLKLSFNKKTLKEMWKFSTSLWALNMLEGAMNRLDFALIGIIVGKEGLGIYYTVRNIVEGLLGFILNPVQTVLLSYYTRLTKSAGYYSYLVRRILVFYLPAALLSMLIILVIGENGVELLLGKNFISGASLLTGLTIYFYSIIWFENIKVFSMSEKIHHKMIMPRILQIISYSILVFPLVNLLGFWGAGFATGIAAAILALFSTISAQKYFSSVLLK